MAAGDNNGDGSDQRNCYNSGKSRVHRALRIRGRATYLINHDGVTIVGLVAVMF